MPQQRSRLADFAVYLLVRVVVTIVQALPFPTACRFADFLAWVAYHATARRRRVADENVRLAFPALDDERRDQMVRACYRHFCIMLMEILFLPRVVHVSNYKKYLRLDESHAGTELILSGRPVLFVTGHYGNWEVSGYAVAMLGFPIHAIARPLDNPHLDNFFRRFRERTGQKLLAKHGDFERMDQLLASGGVLATLADQDAGKRGLFVPFFGRPASTHKAVALMAIEHQVVMIVSGTYRVGPPMHYEFRYEDLIDPNEYRNHPDPVRAITERFTSAFERLVREHPEQYFWLHRRWKHQPAPRRAGRAA